MNRQDLKKRVDDLLVTIVRPDLMLSTQREAIEALLRDVLEEVKPSRAPQREYDDLSRGINIGSSVTIDEMETKQRELGL